MTNKPTTLRELVQSIRTGALDPKKHLEAKLERISKQNGELKALCAHDANLTRKALEERISSNPKGRSHGRLFGTCFSAKDNNPVKGLPVSYGSRHNRIKKADTNSQIVERLFGEDSVCIGKGNMPEYGKAAAHTDNPIYGATSNPFNVRHTPGGSSGGDAAALAAGFSDFGVGGDSGGSLRVPANFCGIFSLLPSHGVISDRGSPFISSTFTKYFGRVGPLARSLDDLELLFEILKGYDPLDPHSVHFPALPEELPDRKIRFAYFSELNGVSCHPEINKTLKKAISQFESAGFAAEDFCPPTFPATTELFLLFAGPASLVQEDAVAQMAGIPRDLSKEGPQMQMLRKVIESELPLPDARTLLVGLHEIERLRRETAPVFEKYDFILSPVCAGLPPEHGDQGYTVNGKTLRTFEAHQFARTANVLNLPAVAFPTGIGESGFPLGLQIIGPGYSDRRLMLCLKKAGFTDCIPCVTGS